MIRNGSIAGLCNGGIVERRGTDKVGKVESRDWFVGEDGVDDFVGGHWS